MKFQEQPARGSRNNFKDRFRTFSEINITPICDVMLVLLTVFIVAAPLLQQGMSVDLPEAASQALERTSNDVILTIDRNGKVFLGDDKYTLGDDELERKLNAVFEKKQRKDLFINADKSIKYGRVVSVMSIAKKAGVERIGMVTQPEKEL